MAHILKTLSPEQLAALKPEAIKALMEADNTANVQLTAMRKHLSKIKMFWDYRGDISIDWDKAHQHVTAFKILAEKYHDELYIVTSLARGASKTITIPTCIFSRADVIGIFPGIDRLIDGYKVDVLVVPSATNSKAKLTTADVIDDVSMLNSPAEKVDEADETYGTIVPMYDGLEQLVGGLRNVTLVPAVIIELYNSAIRAGMQIVPAKKDPIEGTDDAVKISSD